MCPCVVTMAAPTLNLECGASALTRASVAFAMRSGFIGVEEALKQHENIRIQLSCGFEYLGMRQRLAGNVRSHIGEYREAGYSHSHVPCDNRLRHGGHSNSIRTDSA